MREREMRLKPREGVCVCVRGAHVHISMLRAFRRRAHLITHKNQSHSSLDTVRRQTFALFVLFSPFQERHFPSVSRTPFLPALRCLTRSRATMDPPRTRRISESESDNRPSTVLDECVTTSSSRRRMLWSREQNSTPAKTDTVVPGGVSL